MHSQDFRSILLFIFGSIFFASASSAILDMQVLKKRYAGQKIKILQGSLPPCMADFGDSNYVEKLV
jgi:hypothetical protein